MAHIILIGTVTLFQISMTVIPIRVRTEERVKILSMGTNVSVPMVIQEQLAEQVCSLMLLFTCRPGVNYFEV